MIETDLEFRIGDTYERNLTISKYADDIDEMYFSIKKMMMIKVLYYKKL